jgi:hypothetical protein
MGVEAIGIGIPQRAGLNARDLDMDWEKQRQIRGNCLRQQFHASSTKNAGRL